MPHTQSFIANGVDQEFEIPVGSTITAVTVDAVAAPYTTPNPWTVRVTTLPTDGQAVDITYTPNLPKALGTPVSGGLDGVPPITNGGSPDLVDVPAGIAVVDANDSLGQILQTGRRRQGLAPALAGNLVTYGGCAINTTSGGSQSNVVPTFTNYFTSRTRGRLTSNAAINSSAGFIVQEAEVALSGVAGVGAWALTFDFGFNQLNADSRALIGVINRDSSVGSLADPSSLTTSKMIVVGMDAADTQLQIFHHSGTGDVTKIPLGTNFPRPTAAVDFYRFTLWCSAGPTPVVGYRLQNLADPTKVVSGTITTNLPPTNGLHTFSMIAGTGPTTATAVHLDVGGAELIADF